MKKLLAGLAVLSVAIFNAAANTEIDLNFYSAPLASYKLEQNTDVELRPTAPFGFENQFGFYFGSPAKWLDIGLALSDGLDFNVGTKVYYKEKEQLSKDTSFGLSTYLTLGPAVRFNLGNMHSFFVSTGLGGSLSITEVPTIEYNSYNDDVEIKSSNESIISLDYNLDLGYRIWIVNKTGFHFGFDVGYDLTLPLASISSYKKDIKGCEKHKIYFGIAFNFGDKSPDKF